MIVPVAALTGTHTVTHRGILNNGLLYNEDFHELVSAWQWAVLFVSSMMHRIEHHGISLTQHLPKNLHCVKHIHVYIF